MAFWAARHAGGVSDMFPPEIFHTCPRLTLHFAFGTQRLYLNSVLYCDEVTAQNSLLLHTKSVLY